MVKSKEVRKQSIDFHVNEQTTLETGKPVDFSFKKYKVLSAIGIEEARTTRLALPEKAISQKFITRSLWLNNNKLNSISNMNLFVESVLVDPSELAWLDFSFNYITNIDDIILNYKKLKIIYFHGNLISNVDEIKKLKELKDLRSVTFHGNPLANSANYRSYIIAMLPQVVNIDFTPILKSERLIPSPPEVLRKLSKDLGFDDEGEDEDSEWVKYIKDKRRTAYMNKLEEDIDADKQEHEKKKEEKQNLEEKKIEDLKDGDDELDAEINAMDAMLKQAA